MPICLRSFLKFTKYNNILQFSDDKPAIGDSLHNLHISSNVITSNKLSKRQTIKKWRESQPLISLLSPESSNTYNFILSTTDDCAIDVDQWRPEFYIVFNIMPCGLNFCVC